MKLLNVGCGMCFHPEWTNIDLVAATPEVREYDLRQGLPYDDDSFDGVYHSHVLEHLAPESAASMLAECWRVLRPGGTLRVVVPDLEGIAREYLRTLEDAVVDGCDSNRAKHRWMTLELIDQMTRESSGGTMGQLMQAPGDTPIEFIRGRMGHQVDGNKKTNPKKTFSTRVFRIIAGIRKRLALLAVTAIEGRIGYAAYREGRFRQSGEIHRWMYDRVSLSSLLSELGFENPRVCGGGDSSIEQFDRYQLDRDGERLRKPDSLYLEATKPAAQNQAARRLSTTASSSRAA